jgi:tRNA pseudouridine55 synthase
MNYTKESFEQGQVLLLQKPFQWTSFDVIGRTRKITGVRKVGHAGTLDPLATGLLIVCTGKFTKRINEFMGQEKEYTGSFTIGATTSTYDLESEPENFKPADAISTEQIIAATTPFTGVIQQIPPAHSAIKQGGKRVYELARQGKEVKMEPRTVTIKEFEITAIELPAVHFRVVCSTGTYIRSLAFDFGNELGCGAYLSKLCRTRIGDSLLEDAMTMEEFAARVNYK